MKVLTSSRIASPAKLVARRALVFAHALIHKSPRVRTYACSPGLPLCGKALRNSALPADAIKHRTWGRSQSEKQFQRERAQAG